MHTRLQITQSSWKGLSSSFVKELKSKRSISYCLMLMITEQLFRRSSIYSYESQWVCFLNKDRPFNCFFYIGR
jgi:hypothetical protein